MSEYTPTTKAVRTNYAMTMLRVGRKEIVKIVERNLIECYTDSGEGAYND